MSRPRRQPARTRPRAGHRRAPARRAAAVSALAMATLAACAACTPAVSVDVAPHAADPVCASVVLALPAELAQFGHLNTTSQATAAWGDPAAPIVLRCGVDLLPPTTDKCVTATDSTGTSVDWVAVEGHPDADTKARWTFTTYGREPAVEVTVPPEVTSAGSTSFLVDLGKAVAKAKKLRSCV